MPSERIVVIGASAGGVEAEKWEIKESDYMRFRCRVGHAFSPQTMLGGQSDVHTRYR